jgi:hypothetical protein
MLYHTIVDVVEDPKAVVFSKEDDREYLEETWNIFVERLEEILELTFATDYLLAVKSDINFRDAMYPMEFNEDMSKAIWGYKANRWKPEGQSNRFVPIIRKLAVHEGIGLEAVGREADDLLRIWAEQAKAAGDPYVIVSVDKDLKCISGTHFNITSQITSQVSEHEAMRFFYQQLLSGDTTDNIPGVPRIGPVKAEKFLYNLYDEEELQEAVVEQYMTAYPDNWYEMLLSNGKMLYLQKHEDDFFQISHWPVVAELCKEISLHNKPTRPSAGAPAAPTGARVVAPIADIPIPSPCRLPVPRLAPKPVQPEAVPEVRCAATEEVPIKSTTMHLKIPKANK